LECRGCTSVNRESCSASGKTQLTSLNGSPRVRRCFHDAHEFVASTLLKLHSKSDHELRSKNPADFRFVAVVRPEITRKISQNLSPVKSAPAYRANLLGQVRLGVGAARDHLEQGREPLAAACKMGPDGLCARAGRTRHRGIPPSSKTSFGALLLSRRANLVKLTRQP
jgi:hypothetical protein